MRLRTAASGYESKKLKMSFSSSIDAPVASARATNAVGLAVSKGGWSPWDEGQLTLVDARNHGGGLGRRCRVYEGQRITTSGRDMIWMPIVDPPRYVGRRGGGLRICRRFINKRCHSLDARPPIISSRVSYRSTTSLQRPKVRSGSDFSLHGHRSLRSAGLCSAISPSTARGVGSPPQAHILDMNR